MYKTTKTISMKWGTGVYDWKLSSEFHIGLHYTNMTLTLHDNELELN